MKALSRERAVARLAARLSRDDFPRTQMAFLVGITGGAGLLASYSLLRLGMDAMALRYPLALAFAYVVFLGLLWLWLRTKADDWVDVGAVDVPGTVDGLAGPPPLASGGGGDFAGAGASASFEADGVAGGSDLAGRAVGAVAEAEEFAIPLAVAALAAALAAGVAIASFHVVTIAPVLFAELLLDGALSFALYRRLCREDRQHWLAGTVRRTVLPAVATALCLCVVGAAMSAWVPGARSIGEVLRSSPPEVRTP